jgi:uncharacterized protein (TIGR00251 family)
MESFFRAREGSIELSVRLTPKAARDGLEGIGETADGRTHLKARVRAAPEAGRANRALEKLLAKALGLPQRAVTVTAGQTARLKTVTINGDAEEVAQRLRQLAGI